ncbi:hypothetical protein EV363DRAFT_1169125 [Boletus edulis]|nr:hypothetical protein EV363DRAFT_1169125 [Boletus edulis]
MDQENPMPDFADEEARPLREALSLAFGWDEEQAIQHLEATWRNRQDRPEPRGPPPGRDQDPPQGGPPRLQLDEPEVQPEQPEPPQEKKKPTIADFEEDEPTPNAIASRPSQFALQKIAAFEYVELWYFTKEGCFEATKQSRSQADDAFGILAANEVLTLRPVASVKASRNAKADHELSLTEILQARTSFLEHLKEAGWPNKHISALFTFFWTLESHPFRLSMRRGDRILAMYAAKVRRHWHDKLKLGGAFNIANINDALLQQIATEINDEMLSKASSPNANRRARRAYNPRADPVRERRRDSRSLSPPPRFRGSYGTSRDFNRSPTDSKPSQRRSSRDSQHTKSACPLCLGRHPHDINRCTIEHLWDGTPAYARRSPEGRLIDPAGDVLCNDWQKPQGCSRPHNNAKHVCSGCGSPSHGTQKCPKAQPRASSIPIPA